MSSRRSAAHTRETIQIVYLTMRQKADTKGIASQVGCSIQRVRYWQRKLREARYKREGKGNGYGCEVYDPTNPICERCLDNLEAPCPDSVEEGGKGGVQETKGGNSAGRD